jgi:Xaa-Pro aminopeptidase
MVPHLPGELSQAERLQNRDEARNASSRPAPTPPLATITDGHPPRAITNDVVSRADLLREIDEKSRRVQRFLAERKVDAMVLSQVRNVAWITAGLADSHTQITSETGSAALVLTRDGRKFVIASISDMSRLTSEDLAGLGYEPKELPWTDANPAPAIRALVNGGRIATDTPMAGFELMDVQPLRAPLTDSEIFKLRWLARNTAEAVVEVAENVSQGMNERAIEARVSDALMRRNIRPTVTYVGTDERVRNFKHATATDGAVLDNFAMIDVYARRWGLVVSVARLVHFGDVPADLQQRMVAVARVNATMQARTRDGKTASDLFATMTRAYNDAGANGEWQKHTQGGATGYSERDWLILPDSQQRVQLPSAFTFNPTVNGAKVKDTVLITKGGVENLTLTAGWPVITTVIDGRSYQSPGILVRSNATARR